MSTRTICAATALSLLAVLAGCSVTFEARKVDPDKLVPGGIVYQLPMTRIDAKVPGTLETVMGAELADLGSAYAACLLDPSVPLKVGAPKKLTLSLGLPQLRFTQVPDPTQIYSVVVKTDAFLTVSHTFKNADEGFVGEIKSEGENRTGEAVLALAKAFVSTARGGAVPTSKALPDGASFFVAPSGAGKSREVGRGAACKYCGAAKESMNKLFAALSRGIKSDKEIGCADVFLLQGLIEAEKGKVRVARDDLRLKLAEWVARGGGQRQLVPALVDLNEKRIKALSDNVEALQVALHVLPEKVDKQPVLMRLEQGFVPCEPRLALSAGKASSSEKNNACKVPDKPVVDKQTAEEYEVSLTSLVVEAPEARNPSSVHAELNELLKDKYLVLDARPSLPAVAGKGEPGSDDSGYRYRLAAKGLIRAWLKDKDGPRPKVSYEEPVSQYGQVVSLPAKFSGKGAKLEVEFTQRGTLKSVSLGQTAQDPDKVVGSVKGVVDAVRAKPAPADPVAGLEQSLKQQRLELCLTALAATSASSDSLPAVCAGL